MYKRLALGTILTAAVALPSAGISGGLATSFGSLPSARQQASASASHVNGAKQLDSRIAATGDDGTVLGSPAPTSGYCAVWKRRWYDSKNKRWVYTDHNTPAANGSDQSFGTPQNIVVKKGDQGHNDARYGVNANDFWVEALGGNGYGSNGYPYPWLGPKNANGEPTPNSNGAGETGEGGVVQGEVHPAGQSVNFSVWSFSMDDEGDNKVWHDTVQGACVQAGGQTVSTGDIWVPTHNIVPHP